ncbi:ABC transporter ATP-binding protein [Paenibacillus thalictri]|uniref:ABC transporter ATP-binding protein n=1 Tax=Paenibacillus thalictri TaxID=2527873 RepID=A0A4Q9DXJ9_9BACL|nr:ABC transporter ATP-binding protein [Paenibacillus thalictri]TBL81105.1 ABC transporter ATP-binding protein [Paenibacillus thalictri]
MGEVVLAVHEVDKHIAKQKIIHSVSMEVREGQVLALCGGNGAGKSTMLRMIVGIAQPTGGTIEVGGLQWKKDRRGYAGSIGYMPDDYLFGHGLSAEETLSFWASLRKVSKMRVDETLRLVGLHDVRSKAVSSFSKGMRQRLLFAQALLSKPRLLVMDEPTNGLDPYWMESFAKLVLMAKREGHAIIFSTHQLQVAEAIADQVVFLKQGRIVEEGTVSVFRERYGDQGLQQAFHRLFGFQADAAGLQEGNSHELF